jgi:cysteine desulfuration protein SufE
LEHSKKQYPCFDSQSNDKMKELEKKITQKEREIIEEFSLFEDWMDKYAHIIELGKTLPKISDEFKQDNYLIKGCQSQVWLHAEYQDGKVWYSADSDAVITKGIVNLLIRVLSGSTPDEIIDTPLNYINQIGLKEHLSPTRANGLLSMIKQMKLYAMAFKTKQQG